jgi:hypothetical protein
LKCKGKLTLNIICFSRLPGSKVTSYHKCPLSPETCSTIVSMLGPAALRRVHHGKRWPCARPWYLSDLMEYGHRSPRPGLPWSQASAVLSSSPWAGTRVGWGHCMSLFPTSPHLLDLVLIYTTSCLQAGLESNNTKRQCKRRG